MPNTETRADLFQFATRSLLSPANAGSVEEIRQTLDELLDSFGEQSVIEAIGQSRLAGRIGQTSDGVANALRAFAIIIIESRWPKLDAQLVGRIAHMELATGKRLKMDDLGRMYGGQTKQAISKRQGELAQRLGMPNPDSTPASRESHRLMNRSNRAIA